MKWLTQYFQSTTTTEVNAFWPPVAGKQAVVRQLFDLPTHASDSVKAYLPFAEFATIVTRDSTPTQSATHIYIAVDVAAGHVVKGHTLTSSDFLLIPTGTGWKLANPSGVADVASEYYCDVTIASITTAAKAGDKVYVVRAADIVTYTSGGTSLVTFQNFLAGNPGAPICLGAVSNGSNNNTVTATVEWV